MIGHRYLASNIFLCDISVTTCLPNGPSCSSLITICVSVVVKHHCNLLTWPILYNSQFFNVKGFILLINLCFCYIDDVPSICHVLKNSFTSFNHSCSVWNKFAFVVWLDTHVGYVISSTLDNASTWVLPCLYITVKSYSKNNNNHLTIFP
jgi:hypothetical protein